MRQMPFEARRSATMLLLLANVIAFVLECWFYHYPPRLHPPGYEYLALSADGIRHGFVWQLLTFQFMHAGLLHLFFNCWAIYMFGRHLEEVLGKTRFLVLYFSSGVLGGLVQAGLGLLLPYGQFAAPVIGASAGALGLVAAYTMLNPEQPLVFLIFFVLPISVQAKYFLLVTALLAVFGMIFPADNLANAAHLGGILGGILFIRYALHWNWRLPRLGILSRRFSPPPRPPRSEKRAAWPSATEGGDDDLRAEDFVSREVDPILDKISAHGIHSLTERERRILERARARMAKR